MVMCAVSECESVYCKETGNNGPNNVSFFRFPKNSNLRRLWVQRCKRRERFNLETARMCSKHFSDTDFERDLRAELLKLTPRRKLKKDAVPTLNLPERLDPLENNQKKCFQPNFQPTPEEIEALQIPLEFLLNDSEEISKRKKQFRFNEESIEMELLKNENASLKQKITEQENKLLSYEQEMSIERENNIKLQEELNNIMRNLRMVFSENQIDLLLQNKQRVHWTIEELSVAFTLRYFSIRSYKYLQDKFHFPLPSIATLQKWAKLEVEDGILNVYEIIKIAATSMPPKETYVVLQFGEVEISEMYEYDETKDEVIVPHSKMIIGNASGIIGNLHQPFYVDFDRDLNPEILYKIIEKFQGAGYTVVACVCSDISFWEKLDGNFKNPISEKNIHFFVDSLNLLKSIRNYILKTTFNHQDITINKEPLENLVLSTDYNKLSINHITREIDEDHLAVELLSHSTAAALTYYFPQDNLAENTSNFIAAITNWFEIFQGSFYGQNIKQQNEILDKTYELITTLRCGNKKSLQNFQKGILLSIKSLKSLRADVKPCGINNFSTEKLSFKPLKNLFDQIRGCNTQIALQRIKAALLECPGSDDIMFNKVITRSKVSLEDVPLHGEDEENIIYTNRETENDALDYLTGWLANEFRQNRPEFIGELRLPTALKPIWMQDLDGYETPSEEFKATVDLMDSEFNEFIGGDSGKISKTKNIVGDLTTMLSDKFILDDGVISAFARERLLIRINYLNYKNRLKFAPKKRKNSCGDCGDAIKVKKSN